MKKKFRQFYTVYLAIAGAVLVFITMYALMACAAKTEAGLESEAAEVAETVTEAEVEAALAETGEMRFSLADAEGDTFAPYLTEGLDYLILVNKSHPYEFGGEYDQILQKSLSYFADTKDGDPIALDNGARVAFTMLQVYLDNNYDLQIGAYDGYRDYEAQEAYYKNYLRVMYGDRKDCPGCEELTDWYRNNPMAEPGYSEAHTGLLVNVLIKHERIDPAESELVERVGYSPEWQWYTETPERTETIARFKILHEHLADFGFIDRYPAGKGSWTGVPNEPYQIRFVGSSKVAHEIMDHGLSLEEYLGETTKYDLNEEPTREKMAEYLTEKEMGTGE